MSYKFLMRLKLGQFAFLTLIFFVTESLTSKPTQVLPRCMPGGIVLLEYKLKHQNSDFCNKAHKMVLQELTITLGLKFDNILNLDWSNDPFSDKPLFHPLASFYAPGGCCHLNPKL